MVKSVPMVLHSVGGNCRAATVRGIRAISVCGSGYLYLERCKSSFYLTMGYSIIPLPKLNAGFYVIQPQIMLAELKHCLRQPNPSIPGTQVGEEIDIWMALRARNNLIMRTSL